MNKIKRYDLLLVLILVAIYGVYVFDLNRLILDKNLVFIGGDLSFNIFLIKIGMQGNLDGITDVMGWPNGYALFAEPLLGTGPFYAALVIAKIFFTQNVFIVYILTIIAGMITNAWAAYWMVYREFLSKKYTFTFALLVGIAPFVMLRLGQMPIVWLFLIPIIFGIYFRLEKNQISFKKSLLLVAFLGFWSPLFWLLLAIILSLSMTALFGLLFKNYKNQFKIWFTILSGLIVSFAFNYLLILSSQEYKGITSRAPWQSNVFGGRFADILVSSPFLNQKGNLLEKLSEGLSPEGKNSYVGIVFAIGVLITLIYAIGPVSFQKLKLPLGFGSILVVLWLFFITGGLGNLQAAVLLILNQTTPMRAWFRIIVVLGILGIYILLMILQSMKLKVLHKNLILVALIFVTLYDSRFANYITYIDKKDVIEYSAVNFLDINTKDCPVLQFPVDTFPGIQDFTFSNGDKFGYNQSIPHLLSDNNKWSFYGIPGNKYWEDVKKVSSEIGEEDAKNLRAQGYCAILFDKDFSQWQIDRQAGLDSTIGKWPGLRINLGEPNFDNGRYQVFLLTN
jgi:hypothetical protein